jgi:hypothetical protein
MRRIFVLVAAALAAVGVLAPAPSVGAAEPYCGITWGSLDKTGTGSSPGPGLVTNLRAGQHECFDRLVFDLGAPGGAPAYSVGYVPVVIADASGEPVPLAGGAFLRIVVRAHDADLNTGVPSYQPADPNHAVNVAGFRTFRQVYYGGSFEGVNTSGLGVRARLPFRVFFLAGPGNGSRLVIDVAHRWS